MYDFPKDLRKYREGLEDGRVTQEMLAMRMDIASSTYKRIETDKGPKFGIKVFGKLSVYFQNHNQFNLMLGLFESRGLDTEKLRDGFEASQWHWLPELPPAKWWPDYPYVCVAYRDENGITTSTCDGKHILFWVNLDGVRVNNVIAWRYRSQLPGMIDASGGQNDT